MASSPNSSPGNALYPDVPPMRPPHMEFVYRLVAQMHPTNHYEIENLQGTGVTRSVGHIASGSVGGPKVNGIVVENSGADWAQRIHSKKIFYKLFARYTLLTDDGHHILVDARGVFRAGPGADFDYDEGSKTTFLQDDVEYFTHITFEAAGDSPYNWMNGIVAVGVLESVDDKAIIDCWRMTNFPGKEVEDEPPHPTVATAHSDELPAETDIVIIGSGVTGCSVAYHILHDGTASAADLRITVLEARNAVSGATGRNGGHLMSDSDELFAEHLETLGKEEATRILHFTESNIARLSQLVQSLDAADRDAVELRTVTHATGFDAGCYEHAKGGANLIKQHVAERSLGFDVISKEEAIEKYYFKNVEGASQQTGAAALWPYRLFTAVFSTLLRDFKHRFTLETNTPVTAINYEDGQSHPYRLETPRGAIRAKKVIHCTNGYSAHLLPRLTGQLWPFKGTMSRQSPGPSFPRTGDHVAWSLLNKGHYDPESQKFSTGLYYAQQNAQTGDIWVGGEVQAVKDMLNYDDSFVSDAAKKNILSILPRIWKGTEPIGSAQVWSGIMGFTSDHLPMVGNLTSSMSDRAGDGEWIAAGFSGHGMDKCWLTGEAIARMVVHGDMPDGFPRSYLVSDARFDRMSPEQGAAGFVGQF
ncbi:hypothetical protein E8E14_003255 [Neopestalotiopsis sp. 37M]|nr:hypothetical protein E8E14_003255 [Neopestalotiopsis sp. 37M]